MSRFIALTDNKVVMTLFKQKVAREFKRLRKERGYTQEELADRADLEYKYVQRIEGKNPPNMMIETALKLARALGSPLSSIIKKAEHS